MQLGIYRETVAVLLLFLVILGQIKQTRIIDQATDS